ncbi:electron transfer flavoprotein subunit beta/FixA family protein, partial [bacterium]|nr:electron transfer flavoprotein subunit beta/FixA family protein [bacterium]
MKILVTVKKVVNVDLSICVKEGAIVEDGLRYVINAWDENAVEAAVVLKEQLGAETTLVCVGDENATPVIRKAFAMGIENGIHVNDSSLTKA